MNQSWEDFRNHPTSGTKVITSRRFLAEARRKKRLEDFSRMMTVFGKGKAVIKAQLSFWETASPEPPPISGRWSFYTASLFPSSTCAREVRGRHRLKSFGRDAVRNVGNWRKRLSSLAGYIFMPPAPWTRGSTIEQARRGPHRCVLFRDAGVANPPTPPMKISGIEAKLISSSLTDTKRHPYELMPLIPSPAPPASDQ